MTKILRSSTSQYVDGEQDADPGSYSLPDGLGTEESMNDLDRGHRGRISGSLHLSVVGGLAALMLAVLPGVAFAGTTAKTAPHAALSGVSAWQDQYRRHRVLKPHRVVSATAAKVVKAKSATSVLPFTGLALLKATLIGLGLVALGFALRRWPARGNDR